MTTLIMATTQEEAEAVDTVIMLILQNMIVDKIITTMHGGIMRDMGVIMNKMDNMATMVAMAMA